MLLFVFSVVFFKGFIFLTYNLNTMKNQRRWNFQFVKIKKKKGVFVFWNIYTVGDIYRIIIFALLFVAVNFFAEMLQGQRGVFNVSLKFTSMSLMPT